MHITAFEAALIARLRDLPAEAHDSAIAEACTQDQTLCDRLPAILAAASDVTAVLPPTPSDRASSPALAQHALNALEAALAAAPEDSSGARLDNYRLLQKLGEGGFGVVWMAEQQEPIRRRVAVKIIKVGMDTEEVIARFEAERQALALMEHPNIARVFDAGETNSGRPYFVMELVRGVAITRYCDENRLPPEARLRLFVTVCRAVQHAHQKGVIHRDLKPSNILVTLHDGVPVPKIIDFGIAKATSARLTEKTLFTQFHAFIGTPAYTSPEQMEMSGLDIDTRSDIYSLGVLLYELLTGQPPFDADALVKSGLEAMRRTLREIDPPRPSQRLGTLTELNRTSIAHQRDTDAGKLSLLLRGDLDWIAMRCLEKDRTRRYDSATSLAADIERHLADAPVEARPPSRLYQAKKFVRRHKLAVGAATAVTVSLIAGLIASSTLFVRERAAHTQATVAHTRAVFAEKKESDLRHQAEVARADEVKRAARTALDLANRSLADDRVTDGLAYLVYAARKDPLNPTLAPRLASTLAAHNFIFPQGTPFDCGSRVLAVRFAKDGRSFFVGTEDGTFRVFAAATGELRREFRTGRAVNFGGWEFARDNESVVGVRFSDNTFGVFEVATGHARLAPLPLDAGVWHASEILGRGRAVGLSPDGRWIFACANREFWVWDAATGSLRLQRTFDEIVGGSDFSADGTRLALTVGNSVQQWSLPDGVKAAEPIAFRAAPPANQPAYSNVLFSPDARRLIVCDVAAAGVFDAVTGARLRTLPRADEYLMPSSIALPTAGRLYVKGARRCGWWDLESGQFTAVPIPLGEDLVPVSFDAAGQRGLAACPDGVMRLFDLATGALVAEPAWQQTVDFCAALSPDGNQAVFGTGTGVVQRLRNGRGPARPLVLPRDVNPPMPAPFLPGPSARLLRLGRDRAQVIDIASGREVAGGFSYPDSVLRSGSGDSHPPIRSDLKFMVVRTSRGEWQSWELGADGITHAVPLKEGPPRNGQVVFSPSGDRVAITAGGVRVWDLRTGEPAGPAFSYPADIVFVTPNFSPDGRQLALGTADGAAMLIDVATARPVRKFETRLLAPNQRVLFSPDGTRLLTANVRNESRLWNAITGEPIGPTTYIAGSGAQAVFSPSGRWLANWGEVSVVLWDGRTGAPVGKTIPAGGRHVRFSSDGSWLATSGAGNAQVWHAPSGEPVTEPMPHFPARVFAPEFSPDGRFLRTENINFYLWSLPPRPADGATPPAWLLQLATMCAHKVVNEAGELADVVDTVARFEEVRRAIAALPADAPFADWGRWMLNDRPDRPIAPGFTITPAEAAKLTADLAAQVQTTP